MNQYLENQSDAEPDEALLERIVQKDDEAFRALYRRYAARLYGLALRMFRDQDEAEDALQEVFSRIWDRADRYERTRGAALYWILRLSRNLYLDRLRNLRRAADRSRSVDPETLVAAPAPAPMDQEELARTVRRALAALPPDTRQLLELSFFEGWSHSRISHELGLPLGTVKTRLRQGLQALRAALRGKIFASDLEDPA